MDPVIPLHWPAIFAALLAAFVFGFLWYGPIFGQTWARLMGFRGGRGKKGADDMKDMMVRGMILQAISLFFTVFCLAHSGAIWRPSVWGLEGDHPDRFYGFMAGFFTWLGFYLPNQLRKLAWEKASWPLFLINVGHDFLSLQIIAQILSHWRA